MVSELKSMSGGQDAARRNASVTSAANLETELLDANKREAIDQRLSQLESGFFPGSYSYVNVLHGMQPSVGKDEVRLVPEAEITPSEWRENIVIMGAGRGIFVEEGGKHEMATGGIEACGVMYIRGPKEGMLHLTPPASSELGYRQGTEKHSPAQVTADKICAAMKGENLGEYSVTIVLNAGNKEPGNNLSQEVLERDLDNLKRLLIERGFSPDNIFTAQIPVGNSIAFHTPEDPDTLYMLGQRTEVDAKGKLIESPHLLDTYAIPIGGSDGQPRLFRTMERRDLAPN